MRRILPPALVSAALLVTTVWIRAAQAPPVPVPSAAQFPPLGTGVTSEDKATLQAAVDRLAAKVAALKKKYPSNVSGRSSLRDRIADVEVFLDAVRRPLAYDERLYAPRGSSATDYALQTLASGNERAGQLAEG